jgi:hypothetical protein
MFKKLLVSLLLVLPLAGAAQGYEETDRKVLAYPDFASLKEVGIRIQNDFTDEAARVRAAFVWVSGNITYTLNEDEDGPETHRISYASEAQRKEAIDDVVWKKINKSFARRKGVCIDYSLMLNALIEQFGLPSKIITGIVKTEVKEIKEAPYYRNHSWNAVQLNGEWKLMDATWAAGYVDPKKKRFVKNFQDHYFFTDPYDFARHHLPANVEWQLLDTPIDALTFFSSPVLLPDFCEKGIALSKRTSGILTLSRNKVNVIYFDALPPRHLLTYSVDGSGEFRRLGLRRDEQNNYYSKIRLRKRFNRKYEYLTLYMNEEPILNFKIEEEVN